MNKAAIYCRLSKEYEKYKQSESIQNQVALLKEYAMQNGFEIYNIYSDDNYSGLDRERPAFQKMIKHAQEGHFNIILCKTQSRFTREIQMIQKYLEYFDLWKIRLIAVVDNVDTAKKESKKTIQINGLLNEWYCEDLSENIRAVFRSKMEKGQFLGGFAPYGYIKDSADKHKLLIDKQAAEVVQKIFKWYIQGYGVQTICQKLFQEGISPPAMYKKNQFENFSHASLQKKSEEEKKIWSTSTVKKILKNETYIGSVVQGKEQKISYKDKKVIHKPKQEWIVVPNMHEAIIQKQDFDLVQNIMKQKRYETKNKYNNNKEIFLFSGKVYCKYCNHAMYYVRGSHNQYYFYCQVFSRSKGEKCRKNSIKVEYLKNVIMQKIQYLYKNKKIQQITIPKQLDNEMINRFIDKIFIASEEEENRINIKWNI